MQLSKKTYFTRSLKSITMNKKIVLFDIDGTLVYHVGIRKWEEQYYEGLRKVYGITGTYNVMQYNGTVERLLAWELVKEAGKISREEFLKKFPDYVNVMHGLLTQWGKNVKLFKIIPDAVAFVQFLKKNHPGVIRGILTGNARKIADWKLSHTGISKYFSFGLYGDEADDRIELAGQVFAKAKKQFGLDLAPGEVVIIGDTVFDIRCGKAIGAFTIAVTTGMHGSPNELAKENPDLIVNSLMDPSVLSLFSIA